LVDLLADLFPGSESVLRIGLAATPDESILAYGRERAFVVVTKDRGFKRMATSSPGSPKIIWIRGRNYGTMQIEQVLRRFAIKIADFERSDAPYLILQ